MIPKELQDAIEKHILNKVENNKNVAEFEWDILSEGACLALEYMGERWVSCKERLPETWGYYLTYNNNLIGLAEWTHDNTWRELVTPKEWEIFYWMPLPQPPKTTNDEK